MKDENIGWCGFIAIGFVFLLPFVAFQAIMDGDTESATMAILIFATVGLMAKFFPAQLKSVFLSVKGVFKKKPKKEQQEVPPKKPEPVAESFVREQAPKAPAQKKQAAPKKPQRPVAREGQVRVSFDDITAEDDNDSLILPSWMHRVHDQTREETGERK